MSIFGWLVAGWLALIVGLLVYAVVRERKLRRHMLNEVRPSTVVKFERRQGGSALLAVIVVLVVAGVVFAASGLFHVATHEYVQTCRLVDGALITLRMRGEHWVETKSGAAVPLARVEYCVGEWRKR